MVKIDRRGLRRSAVVLSMLVLTGPAVAGPLLEALRERRAHAAGTESEMEGRGAGSLKGDFALPAGARLLRDIAYGDDPQQRLDVYIPAGAKAAPIIFMVHGGAWILGDKAYLPVVEAKVGRWLPKGYVFVSTNYRMSRNPNVLDQVDDVARALAYAQQKSPEWGADPHRLLLMGHSAGAHLVSLLASTSALAKTHSLLPWRGTVSLDSAALDLVKTMEAEHYRFYDRVFGSDRNLWRDASPYHQLSGATAPFLLVCTTGRADSCPQSEAFAGKVRSLGGRATVLPVEMKHGETNTDLGKPTAYTESVESFMREVGLP